MRWLVHLDTRTLVRDIFDLQEWDRRMYHRGSFRYSFLTLPHIWFYWYCSTHQLVVLWYRVDLRVLY